ncbi:MAG: glycosyltransferase [Anaerolineae bacterium]|nr:glycosyltransferase [Anaerolineae bacterium]
MSRRPAINELHGATATEMAYADAKMAETIHTLGIREQFRDEYWRKKDPIFADRLLWRAQSFRQMVHLLPGASILELGAGSGLFTEQLQHITRGENPITAVTFQPDTPTPPQLAANVTRLTLTALPGVLEGRQFDTIIAMDLLDQSNSAWFLQQVYTLLASGGQVIFYESNPWNVVLKVKRSVARLFGRKDPRNLLNRTRLYELISEVGFIRLFAVYNDFVYAPLNRPLVWLLRNLSILLENAPVVRSLAGSILIHAQKPPGIREQPPVSLCEHSVLHRSVSFVVPCHNEEMNLEPLVNQIRSLYDDYIHEIVLVDDNSRDQTATKIRQLAATDTRIKPVYRRPPNGVGLALMDGYRVATGRFVLSMDCDFQHLLPEIRDLFDAAAAGYDVVVGSRFSRHSVLLNYPFGKIFANRSFHILAQLLLRRKFRDLTNNLKLMRREVLDQLPLSQPGFSINAETGLYPLFMGFRVKEVPISWINRTPDMGLSSFKLAQVGGGYWHVLRHLCIETRFGTRLLPPRELSGHE